MYPSMHQEPMSIRKKLQQRPSLLFSRIQRKAMLTSISCIEPSTQNKGTIYCCNHYLFLISSWRENCIDYFIRWCFKRVWALICDIIWQELLLRGNGEKNERLLLFRIRGGLGHSSSGRSVCLTSTKPEFKPQYYKNKILELDYGSSDRLPVYQV
jgi:hypothetical protein